MKYLVMIQARMGSSRLPNKVLKEICGKPNLQWVVERVKQSQNVDEVMVVTSIEKNNLPLIQLCTEMGVRIFVGSDEDVLDRFYQAAKLLSPEYVVRITADCPLFDWRYLDKGILEMKSDSDYLHLCPDSYPDGLDFEIVRFCALHKSWKEARLYSEREHVTLYIKNHPEIFQIQELEFPIAGCGNCRWTLDEEADFEVIKRIYEHFLNERYDGFVTEDILDYIKIHPDISEMNAHIGRNEGLVKSLANDRVFGNCV